MAKYLDIISKDAKQKEVESFKFAAEEAELGLKNDIFAAKVALSRAEKAVSEAIASVPLDTEEVIERKRELAEAKEDFNDLEALYNELFGA
jgi:hypothetical protein